MKNQILKLLFNMAQYHDTDLSPMKAEMYAQDLSGVNLRALETAWAQYRLDSRNGNKMPSPAQLLALIDDGRPTANTAWAMIPQNQDDSCVWTDEMREAWSYAWPHVKNGNSQAAFFTFKENYERIVAEKRAQRLPPKWTPSFGLDKAGREDALIKAVQQKRISISLAQKYLPEIEENPRYESLLSYEEKMQIGHRGERFDEVKSLVASLGKKEF